MVTLLAAVGPGGEIGLAGALPWHLPEDLAHFKRVTWGHVLVMGRATFESIGRPLPGRSTVVVTGQDGWRAEGVVVAGSVEAALALAAGLARAGGRQVFVVGGGQVYRQAMPYADRLLLSRVHAPVTGDTFFPPVDPAVWTETSRQPMEGFDLVTYERAGAGAPTGRPRHRASQ